MFLGEKIWISLKYCMKWKSSSIVGGDKTFNMEKLENKNGIAYFYHRFLIALSVPTARLGAALRHSL